MTITPFQIETMKHQQRLQRLPDEHYQGHAIVFWTHNLVDRATGWLDAGFHANFREVLLHTCARYQLSCPLYVLMPDHWHLILMGAATSTDQKKANAFLRKHGNAALGTHVLQKQAHDHVLRDRERDRDAFVDTCHYIRQNPVRDGLVERWQDWPWLGALVPGYPDLHFREDSFWETYWKCHHAYRESLEK